MRFTASLITLGAISAARYSPGTVVDDSPLVVVYYENWAGWIRNFSPSHVEKNILSRNMPVRNFVLNYAFYTWNYNECSLIPVDSIDLQKGDKGGWTGDDWNIDSTEAWARSGPAGGHLNAFMMLKSMYPHIKLLPSIGGWSRSHTFHDCLINKPEKMLQSIIDHVSVWGWDGVDFDWEYPNCDGKPCGCQNEATCTNASGFSNVAGPGDWDRYKVFVKAVRSAFNNLEDTLGRRLYITAALGMNPKIITGNNDVWSTPMPIEWMCEEDDFDWVNLMAYDFYGPWAQLTGPLAPLYPNPNVEGDQMSIDDSLTKILARCNHPEKLTMGLATYGKAWQQVPNTGEVPGLWQSSTAADPRGGGTWEQGTLSYFDLKHNILPSCTRSFDPHSKTPTAYCSSLPSAPSIPYDQSTGPVPRGQPNTFISYEDGESWKEKMAYARSKGMAGAIIWAASDTGCGESFAPDSTTDLFEGLFEGWFGQPMTLPASTSLAQSPGKVQRWAEYPCPLVTGWSTGAKEIDVSRCAGLTYTPGKTYLTIPTAPKTNDLGKDKILIHPIGSAPTQPTSGPVATTTPTTTTAAAIVTTTSMVVPAGPPTQPCVCVCDNSTTASAVPPPAIPSTPAAVPTTTTTHYAPPTTTRAAVLTTTPSSPAFAGSPSAGCKEMLTSQAQWVGNCRSACDSYYRSAWCPTADTAADLAKCVISQMPYCTMI